MGALLSLALSQGYPSANLQTRCQAFVKAADKVLPRQGGGACKAKQSQARNKRLAPLMDSTIAGLR
jgi:hypothetical protein